MGQMPPEMANWGAPSDTARPFLHILAQAARACGAQLLMEPRFGHVGCIVHADGRRQMIFGNGLGLNSDAAAALAADKTYACDVLAASGLPVPAGVLLVSERYRQSLGLKNAATAAALPDPDVGLRFAETVGYPVFVKPNKGAEGAGVSCARGPDELSADIARLMQTETHLRIEAACPGRDVRVLVLDGQVRAAYERRALSVVGDGANSLDVLLAARLGELAAAHRGAKLAVDDPRIARTLSSAGLDLSSVPARGAEVAVLPGANLSTGGQLRDVSDTLPADTADMAVAAAGALGLRLAGVDLLLPHAELMPERGVVLEVNSAPGLDFYAGASSDAAARSARLVTDAVTRWRDRIDP